MNICAATDCKFIQWKKVYDQQHCIVTESSLLEAKDISEHKEGTETSKNAQECFEEGRSAINKDMVLQSNFSYNRDEFMTKIDWDPSSMICKIRSFNNNDVESNYDKQISPNACFKEALDTAHYLVKIVSILPVAEKGFGEDLV